MKKQTVKTKELLSPKTAEKLDAALTKGNIEQLKKIMEKLFTFKNIFTMHDDHLIDLAEFIVDLSKAEDRGQCAYEIEQYARRRISRYTERKKKLREENEWAKAVKTISSDEVSMLDLSYRLWVFESGFEYSKYRMYTMMVNIAQIVQKQEDDKNET